MQTPKAVCMTGSTTAGVHLWCRGSESTMLCLFSHALKPHVGTPHLQGRCADHRGCAGDSPRHEWRVAPQGREFRDQVVIKGQVQHDGGH